MQDVHWYSGLIGGRFQGYTLANLIGAQFDQTAMCSNPEITVDIDQGKFNRLHQWLKDNIYQHGSKYTTSELLAKVTGKTLTVDAFIKYIDHKYKELFSL